MGQLRTEWANETADKSGATEDRISTETAEQWAKGTTEDSGTVENSGPAGQLRTIAKGTAKNRGPVGRDSRPRGELGIVGVSPGMEPSYI